ncbi:MAG: hydrogenase maturation protease [Geminicoccaceae bacterium]
MADRRLLIIGVGNPDRGDDGAGRAVIVALRERLGARMKNNDPALIEHCGEATSLVEVMKDFSDVVIVDAADFGAEPGSHRRFDVGLSTLPAELTGMSSHGFGIPQAIELARALGTLPQHCSVYAIQAATFDAGESLSPDVATAVDIVAAEIITDVLEAREPSHA